MQIACLNPRRTASLLPLIALLFLGVPSSWPQPAMAQNAPFKAIVTAEQQCRENLKRINMALEMYSMDTNSKPDTLTDEEVSPPDGKYFRGFYLKTPFSRPTPDCRYSGKDLNGTGKVTCSLHGLADKPNPIAIEWGKRPEVAAARARSCRANAKVLESLIAMWEAKKVELATKPNAWVDIGPDGSFQMDGSRVDLNEIGGDPSMFVCPEASARFGPGYDKPSYRFFNFDNTGAWIKGSGPTAGKKGVACIYELDGRILGKLDSTGPDGKADSAHHE